MSDAHPPPSDGSAAQTFSAIWEALVDVLGSAAAATLVRRAISVAKSSSPGLNGLAVSRVGFEYRYAVPTAWTTQPAITSEELRTLVRQLDPLLRELTGPVVVRRLRALPAVSNSQLFEEEAER